MTRQELFTVLSKTVKDYSWDLYGTMRELDSEECESLAESIMDIRVEPGVSLAEKVTK
jgi:hypothetical protein